MQGIYFTELKRQGERQFAREAVPVGGPPEMRYQGTLEYQKEVFSPTGLGE